MSTTTEPKPELTQAQKIERLFDALPPIFREVVDPDPGRYDTGLPWVADGRCYATNGVILVAVEATEAIATLARKAKPERGKLPDAKAVWSDPSLYHSDPVAIPDAAAFLPCPECGGFGRVVGDGSAWLCEDCDGSGRVRTCERVVIDRDMTIGSYYAAILRRHEALAYLPLVPNTPKTTLPLLFTCEGGVSGRLMPLSRA